MARIRGNNSNNSIVGTSFSDEIFAFSGNDRVTAGNGNDIVWGGGGNDTIFGGDNNDRLFGESGLDTLIGDAGNDTLEGGSGADRHFGSAGIDWVSYGRAKSGVSMDLQNNTGNAGDAAGDTFSGIENIIGSNFDDGGGLPGGRGLYGNSRSNIIKGLGGDDTLVSNGGNDTLLGGSGNDIIQGGSGADYLDGGAGIDNISCSVDSAADKVVLHRDAADIIFLWDENDLDKFVISKSEFGLSSATTALANGTSFLDINGLPDNTQGTAGVKIFINDMANDTIYFDKDGAGGVDPILIARVVGAPKLLDSDFLLIA